MKLHFYSTEEVREDNVLKDSGTKTVNIFCIPADSISEASEKMSTMVAEWTGPIAVCSPLDGMPEVFDVSEFQNL